MEPRSAQVLCALTAFAAGVSPEPPHPPDSPVDWEEVTQGARLHGLSGALADLADAWPGLPICEGRLAEWHRLRLVAETRAETALAQLAELGHGFAAAGIPAMALKGGAAMLDLYPTARSRELGDIDLLVSPEDAGRAAERLRDLGYAATSTARSREEAEVALLATHLPPFVRSGSFAVELHAHPFGAECPQSTPGFWSSAAAHPQTGLLLPPPALFIVHAAWHFRLHSLVDQASLKWLADILAAANRDPAWEAAEAASGRLRLWGDVRPVLASLRRSWGGVAGLPGDAGRWGRPLPLATILGRPAPGPVRAVRLLRRHHAIARLLPSSGARFNYWLGLLYPSKDSLEYRYGAATSGRGARPRHLRTLAARLLSR